MAGVALLVVAAFMGLGFAQVGEFTFRALVALAIGAGIPGVAGVALLRTPGAKVLAERKAALRAQTVESEILRLARRSGGKLTTVEVVSELAIDAEEAGRHLDSLARREIAEIQVSDSGVLVYDFHDLRHLGEKDEAKGLLDG